MKQFNAGRNIYQEDSPQNLNYQQLSEHFSMILNDPINEPFLHFLNRQPGPFFSYISMKGTSITGFNPFLELPSRTIDLFVGCKSLLIVINTETGLCRAMLSIHFILGQPSTQNHDATILYQLQPVLELSMPNRIVQRKAAKHCVSSHITENAFRDTVLRVFILPSFVHVFSRVRCMSLRDITSDKFFRTICFFLFSVALMIYVLHVLSPV